MADDVQNVLEKEAPVNDMWDCFSKGCCKAMDEHIPSKFTSQSPGSIPRSNECLAGRKSFGEGPLKPSLLKTELHTTRPRSILSLNVGRPTIATSMIWWLSPQRVNLTLLRDSGPSLKAGNVTTVVSPPLKRMGSLTVIAKSRQTSSMNNFRQSSPTRIQHLSLTWGPLRTLIWLTSTSTNQEYARY